MVTMATILSCSAAVVDIDAVDLDVALVVCRPHEASSPSEAAAKLHGATHC